MSNGEAFGLSLFEAMACALPCIVYDYPPFDSLVPTHVLKKIKNKSIQELRNALISYKDKAERENYGIKARNYVLTKFSVKKMASNYFKLMNGICA